MSPAERALHLLDAEDSFAAVESLAACPDPAAAAAAYDELVRTLYWKHKNLSAVMMLAPAGIQHCLAASARADLTPAVAQELKGRAKTLAYNLASFTWPGWDEPGIDIGPSELRLGRDAAKANVRLAHELDKGNLPLSRAYWMLGAHDLAAGDTKSAMHRFAQAQHHAARAGASDDEHLAQGFRCITQLLENGDNDDARDELTRIVAGLATTEHGREAAKQLETALRVFSGKGVPGGPA